jgi:hypothetical protein
MFALMVALCSGVLFLEAADIAARWASVIFREASLARVVGELIFPFLAADIFARVSAEHSRPIAAFDILARDSSECRMPLLFPAIDAMLYP